MVNILALDVGYRNTGWTYWQNDKIKDFGVIATTKPSAKLAKVDEHILCMTTLAVGLHDLIVSNKIDFVCGEMPTGGAQSADAAIAMAWASATVQAVVTIMEIEHGWVTPVDVKKVLLGENSGKKDTTMAAVRQLYPSIKWPKQKYLFEHIADSVGAKLAWDKFY